MSEPDNISLEPLMWERLQRHEAEVRVCRANKRVADLEWEQAAQKHAKEWRLAVENHNSNLANLKRELESSETAHKLLVAEIESKYSIDMKDWAYDESGTLVHVPAGTSLEKK